MYDCWLQQLPIEWAFPPRMLVAVAAFAGWYTSPKNLEAKTADICQYFLMFTDDIDGDSQFVDRLQNVFFVAAPTLELFSVIEG